ncbi:MAG: DUF362 domain-containing protein [Thermoguttaceae bacterium]|nr:DUF362 domain-containing protein [Thermoguttaceae bacterium]
MMNRHDFLKTMALSGVATTMNPFGLTSVMTQKGYSAETGLPFDLVAVMGGEPVDMYKKAIAELGGIKTFVKPGNKVTLKPNMAWDRTPEGAANTNPDLMGAIVRDCLEAGAKEVVVFDHTCDDWEKAYKTSGIADAVTAAGGRVVPADLEKYYREVKLPRAKNLKTAKIHEAILDCDVWFNIPILKNHGGANMTIAMKNLMGIVWDRRAFHDNDLQQCIADICTLEKPAALHIIDAYRAMKENGPRGRSLADVVNPKGLFMSTDPVAADTAAVKFFGQIREMPLEIVTHLANGQDLKIGTMDIDSLKIKRIKM